MQATVHIDDKAYVLELDEAQLLARGEGDLITCEIAHVLPNQSPIGKVPPETRGNKKGRTHGS